MKKYILFTFGLLFSISINAQNTFIEVPHSYWETFKIEDALKNANNGDVESQFMVALYYSDVEPDNVKFRYWIEKAVAQNHAIAQYLIAKCYSFGDYGFTIDEAKALEYARKAASLNDISAIGMMFDAYRIGLFGLSKDDQQAAYWAAKGAHLGDAYLQCMLGTMLIYGIGGVKDEKVGLFWLQKSADQKYIEAQCTLIHFYTGKHDEDSHQKLMLIGLDFLINPAISQNSESILLAKGFVGVEFFNRKNYKRGIQLVREGLKTQNKLLQFYWNTMNEYANKVLGTTIKELENQ